MKIDRLIGILSILLQREMVTAPYLADQFEVFRRTINRDIEDSSKAGIPVVTKQGVNGGISIMDNYKLERTLLTNTEMRDILAGLRSLDSINETNRYGTLLFHVDYTDKKNLITWILTFREQVKLLEPEDIRNEIQQIIEKMKERYS